MKPPSELVECYGPARPEDSLKYACVSEGFASRGVPLGLTKREAYCSRCEADHCIHHSDTTPKMVMRGVATQYLERSLAWTLYAERGKYRERRKEQLEAAR